MLLRNRLILLVLFTSSQSVSSTPEYSIRSLGKTPSYCPEIDINNRGEILLCERSGVAPHCFLIRPDGSRLDLTKEVLDSSKDIKIGEKGVRLFNKYRETSLFGPNPFDPTSPESARLYASVPLLIALNDRGDFVGFRYGSSPSSAIPITWRWEIPGSNPTYIDPQYMGIAAGGFLWSASEGIRLLPELMVARGINNLGAIVGTPPRAGAYLRRSAGDVTDLWAEAGCATAMDINDAEEVVGSWGGTGCIWDATQGKTVLGQLGSQGCFPMSLNNKREAVGYSSVTGPFEAMWDGLTEMYRSSLKTRKMIWRIRPHAFLWREGTMVDLNDLVPEDSGWLLLMGQGINDQGQIVGSGIYQGAICAFLLTPKEVGE